MPRLKRKWMLPQAAPSPVQPVKPLTPYFRMRDGKSEVGVPFHTLYKLYQAGELRAAPLIAGGALYVKRTDFDAMWEKKLTRSKVAA